MRQRNSLKSSEIKRLVYASAPAAVLVTYMLLLVWVDRRAAVATQSWFSQRVILRSDDVTINSDADVTVDTDSRETMTQPNKDKTRQYDVTGSVVTDDAVRRNNSTVLYNYNFLTLIDIKDGCRDRPDIVGYVHTRAGDTRRRDLIRATYGSIRQHDGLKVQILFFIGSGLSRDDQQRVSDEAANNNDLVQLDFRDTYRNLTYKQISGLKWILDHCGSAEMIVKVDDDVFTNIYRLVDFYRHTTHQRRQTRRRTDVIYCSISHNVAPKRHGGKWRVTVDEYSDVIYPTYCRGFAQILSRGAAQRIWDVANSTKFFWVDDIFVTGVLRTKAKVAIRPFHPGYGTVWRLNQQKSFTNIETAIFALHHSKKRNLVNWIWPKFAQILRQKYSVTSQQAVEEETSRNTTAADD